MQDEPLLIRHTISEGPPLVLTHSLYLGLKAQLVFAPLPANPAWRVGM